MEELVSVIVPVYNAANTIEDTVYSALNQTYENLEIIIIDDCSSDHSLEILSKIKRSDRRVRIYNNKKNSGVAQTRNKAISLAKGKYIAFLDSDDLWMPNKIQLQLNALQDQSADICYTAYNLVDENEVVSNKINVPKHQTYEMILKENSILCSSVLSKREILKQNPFKVEFFHEDLVLWLELLKSGYKAIGLQQYLVSYKKGGRSADKVRASINRWKVYRECEKLSIHKSSYYFINYIIRGIKKYYLVSTDIVDYGSKEDLNI